MLLFGGHDSHGSKGTTHWSESTPIINQTPKKNAILESCLNLTPSYSLQSISKPYPKPRDFSFGTNWIQVLPKHRHRNRASRVSWSSITSVGDEGRSPCNGVTTGAWPERSFAFRRWLIWVWKSRMGGLNVGRFGGLILEGLLVICAGRPEFHATLFQRRFM